MLQRVSVSGTAQPFSTPVSSMRPQPADAVCFSGKSQKPGTVYYIGGPTCSGKTSLCVDLAKRLPNARFINADTMQLYRGLEELAATPSSKELSQMDHRMYGVLDLDEDFSRSQWFEMAKQEIDQAFADDKIPVLVGGSRSFMEELARSAYDIEFQADMDNLITYPHEDAKHLDFPYRLASIVLAPDNNLLFKQINREVDRRDEMIDMVREVSAEDHDFSKPAFWVVGFHELKAVLERKISMAEALEQLREKVLRYAIEQIAMFNGLFEAVNRSEDPSRSIRIESIDAKERVEQVLAFMAQQEK